MGVNPPGNTYQMLNETLLKVRNFFVTLLVSVFAKLTIFAKVLHHRHLIRSQIHLNELNFEIG